MTRKQKKTLYRILLSAFLFVLGIIISQTLSLTFWHRIAAMFPAYFIIGYDVLQKAASGIGRGQIFDENFLMSIASLGAFAVGEAPEGVAVMLFYQIGELFQNIAIGKSRKSISDLLVIIPDVAHLIKDGKTIDVSPEELQIGDTILVKPGEKIPLDGKIIEGFSSLDTSALTGESIPRDVKEQDAVYSSSVNLQGILKIRCTKPFSESTASRIMELVENSEMHKAKTEKFITRFSKYYTPTVVLSALMLAVIPPLFLGLDNFSVWANWIHTALVFLIVSCPCALVISVPMAFFGGIGGASHNGILIKGANHLEMLSKCDTIVFDKTGTLTKGSFSVTEVHPQNCDGNTLLHLMASAEYYSNHPIARSLKDAAPLPIDPQSITHAEEIAGGGVYAIVDGNKILVGSNKLLSQNGIQCQEVFCGGTCIHATRNGEYLGYVIIKDTPKEDAAMAVQALAHNKIKNVLLTGDRKEVATELCNSLGITEMHAELLPDDKVTHFEAIQKITNGYVAFVGDGINDAPVLARSDVGIAMGAIGQDAAIEAADIVLMNDKPSDVVKTVILSRKTMRIVRQNVALALGVKIGILLLDLLVASSLITIPGMAMTWIAVFGDVGVAILAILNSLRAMRI